MSRLAITGLIAALPLLAQLAPPNASGVSMGHLHLNVQDMEAARAFWVALGAKPAPFGRMEAMKFPDVIVLLSRVETPAAGTEGSTVGHLGFRVRDLAAV